MDVAHALMKHVGLGNVVSRVKQYKNIYCMETTTKKQNKPKIKKCPECSTELKQKDNCVECHKCGWGICM